MDEGVEKFPVEELDPAELEKVMNGPGPLIGAPVLNKEWELVKKLHATTDAKVWAEEWCRIATDILDRGEDIVDEGWMIGWFANAFTVAEMQAKAQVAASDEFLIFRRGELFEFLGKMALPPWKDEHGNDIGGGIDCAPIAQELTQWVDEHSIRRLG